MILVNVFIKVQTKITGNGYYIYGGKQSLPVEIHTLIMSEYKGVEINTS